MGIKRMLQTKLKIVGVFLMVSLFVFPHGSLFAMQDVVAYNITSVDLQEKFYKTQIDEKISLVVEKGTVETALRHVANKTGLKLTYRGDIIDKHVISIKEKEIGVTDALNLILEGTGLDYLFSEDGYLLIFKNVNKLEEIEVQEQVVGTVTDARTGETLPGVNIMIQGTTTGVSTDEMGRFQLSVPSLNEVLIFTYIGYKNKEVAINGRSELNVEMESITIAGAEIVVTAFGVTKERRAINYSSAQIESKDVGKALETNLVNSLSGRMAGVQVQGNSTGPGGSGRIVIRGNTSLAGDNQPLYVVNGMPINNTSQGDQGPVGDTVYGDRGDGISHINPSDIESMTVLKGGQATALYGSRAANGVILITTKQGSQSGGIGIEFNSTTMFNTISKYPDWQQEYGHGTAYKRPETQREAASTGRLSFGEPVDGKMYTGINGERPYSPVSVKQNMNNFYDVGVESHNTLAFSGGSEQYNYRISLSNLDANAMMPNSSYHRKTANSNLNIILSDRINIRSSFQYNVIEGINRPQGGYATYNANWNVGLLASTMDIRDLSPGYYEDTPGREMLWNPSSAAPNAYWVVNKYRNEDSEKRFFGNVEISYALMKNLIVRGSLGQDVRNFNGSYVIPTGTAYRPNGVYNDLERKITETNSQLILNYESPLTTNFNFSGMVGGRTEHYVGEVSELSGQDFIVPYFYSFSNLASSSNNRDYSEQQTNSLFGSAEFDYKNIVYLTITGRQDWFSTLNPENNSIFYPSIGGSVILSDAIQMPDIISFLKLRGSWAQIGSAIVPPYVTNESYTFLAGGFGGLSVQDLSGIPTPGLRPLQNTTFEVGVDLEFFDRRLAFDLSLYSSTTKEDIVNTQIARSSGYTSTRVNIGELNNKGIEFMIRGVPIQSSSFNWNTSFNVSYNKSEVLKLADGLDQITLGAMTGGGFVKHTVGKPYGMIYGNEYLTNENGQIVFNRNSGLPVAIEMEQGRGVAPLSMGLSNSFSYKNLSLDILLDARFGSVLYSNTHWYAYRMGLPKETLEGRVDGLNLSGVDEEGLPFERTIPRNQLRSSWYNNGSRYAGRFVHDNSFIKLREITISYNIPVSYLTNLPLHSASVSLVGRNLLNLYDPIPHVDPESGNSSGNLQGLEGFGLPFPRTMGFNLSLNF